MRIYLLLASASLVTACGGGSGGVNSSGNLPPVGGIIDSGHTFVDPKEPKTYEAIGAVHSYQYVTSSTFGNAQREQLYQGDANTARDGGIEISYSPRDGIFQVEISEGAGGVNTALRFQDPVHRTDFGGDQGPQTGTPNFNQPGMNYLEAGGHTGIPVYDLSQSDMIPVGDRAATRDITTLFYQKPGTTTKYVTFAGFVRNSTQIQERTDPLTERSFTVQANTLQRGAWAYGERTRDQDVPRSGTGTFNGGMIASMIFNPLLDTDRFTGSYFQWLDGSAQMRVDFGANSFEIDLTGRAHGPQFDVFSNRQYVIRDGAAFNARGSGRIDILHAGGFLGDFQSAWFVQPDGTRIDLTLAGSSVNGAFYGPKADEVGGGFRIVGGNPDERIDILGAFTGKK